MQRYLSLFLKLYSIYTYVYTSFIDYFGPIYFIYYFKNGKFKNITLNYYLNIGLYQYINGIYFCKVLHSDISHHIVYSGRLNQIEEFDFNAESDIDLTRKNIILYNNDQVITKDLKTLDNYVFNMKKFGHNHLIGAKELLPQLGYNCTHIHLQKLRPFKKEILEIEKIDLDELHH